MTDSQLQAPQDDLADRRPVWNALADLFLDTELTSADIEALAVILAQSPYTNAELAAIYHAEVAPVCQANIGMAPGFWAGFPDGWVEQEVLSRGLDASRDLAARDDGIPTAWGWGGLQQRFLQHRQGSQDHETERSADSSPV